jgi:bifunctional DNase/RNase
MEPVPCGIKGVFVAVSAHGTSPTVLLDAGADLCIPIFIGLWEAISINNALNKEVSPRPLTHDLFIEFLNRYHISMRALHIDSLDDGVFYAKLMLDHENREEILDCRPSDGIAIAIRCGAGIFLDKSVIESSSVKISDLPPFVGLNTYLYG